MFSLSAFIGYLINLLLLNQHYSFCLIIIGASYYLFLLEYKNHKSNRLELTYYLLIGLICGSIIGYFTYQRFRPRTINTHQNRIIGKIISISENSMIAEALNPNGQTDKIKLSRIQRTNDINKSNNSIDPFLFDNIIFSCSIWRTNPSYGIFATLEKLQGIGNVCNEVQIHSIQQNHVTFNKIRRNIRNHTRQSLNLLGESSYARGFILNDTSNINQVEIGLFRKMGIAHLFSASGLHMGLLYATCFLPLSYLGFKKTGYSLSLIVCFVYLSVLDFSIPLLRSYIFISSYIFLRLFKRKTSGKYILYFSIILLELIFPLSCFSPSFILSFLITLMILLYYPQFKKVIILKNNYLKEHLALTISASLGSCFLSVFLFNYYHPISVLYNLILVPVSGIYLASIFIYLIFPIFKYIIFSGDYIFSEACWIHYQIVEKYLPENHFFFTMFWIVMFFLLTLYFIFLSFHEKYWYLRKYYMNTYIILSIAFLSNYLFINIPTSASMAFPFGIIQYRNYNYYIAGNFAQHLGKNMKYFFQKMNFPFHEIYATDNFIKTLHENKIHQKMIIHSLNMNTVADRKSGIIRLNNDCYFFYSVKNDNKLLKRIIYNFSNCENIYLVYGKKNQPNKNSIKKLFSVVGLSENVHYMNYLTWIYENKPKKTIAKLETMVGNKIN